MELTCPAFLEHNPIPTKYTCDGENVNPPLLFTGVPQEAQSLALLLYDPDAPIGDWLHWIVWNIPGSTTQFSEGSTPVGAIEGQNDFKTTGYGDPCPPHGTLHHYLFELYALDTTLELPLDVTMSDIKMAMQGHVIDKTELAGTYERTRL